MKFLKKLFSAFGKTKKRRTTKKRRATKKRGNKQRVKKSKRVFMRGGWGESMTPMAAPPGVMKGGWDGPVVLPTN